MVSHVQHPTLRADLNEHLQALVDIDRCALVSVRFEGALLVIEVTTSDGRTASRIVSTENELFRAGEALLTLPPNAPPPPAPSAPSPQEFPPVEPKAIAPSTPPRLELGIGLAGRIGGSPLFGAGGIAAFADVALEEWLLGVSGRWDIGSLITEPALPDYYMMSSAVGVSVGRRFELGTTLLDTLVGTNVVLEDQDADYQDADIFGSAADVRFAGALRVSGSKFAAWRPYATLDAELSPERLVKKRRTHPDLPPLPSWSTGLSVGIMWGAR